MNRIGILIKHDLLETELCFGDSKQSVSERLRKIFNEDDYNIYETKHNIIVEHLEYIRELQTRLIIRIVFNEEEEIVCITIGDAYELGVEALLVDDDIIGLDKDELMEKYPDFSMNADCPYDHKLTYEELNDNSTIKLCSDKYKEYCSTCNCRSYRELAIVLKDKNKRISYNVDYPYKLSILSIPDIPKIMVEYGYSQINNVVEDNIENNIIYFD